MISHTTAQFREAFRRLPIDVQQKAHDVYRLWRQDPWRPSLRFKRIHPVKPIYSVRISLSWRAVGIRKGDMMIWYWIGSHSDYDNLIASRKWGPEAC